MIRITYRVTDSYLKHRFVCTGEVEDVERDEYFDASELSLAIRRKLANSYGLDVLAGEKSLDIDKLAVSADGKRSRSWHYLDELIVLPTDLECELDRMSDEQEQQDEEMLQRA